MSSKLPPWVKTHQERRERDDIETYRAMTPQQRWLEHQKACAWSWSLMSANPNREAALNYREPRSAESLALWKRLMSEAKNGE